MPENYINRDLRGKSFKGQDLTGADFSYADIRGGSFKGAILKGANFANAKGGVTKKSFVVRRRYQKIICSVSAADIGFVGLGRIFYGYL